uniref:NR LBD domain-containing protein n=2 Tax=Acrobeloides nanus TaxID=290746 RepID=A0A914C3C4_9BILA
MQQLHYGFSLFYEEIKPKGQVVVITEFDRYSHMRYQEKFMTGLARALMYCDHFAALDYSDKFILYKNTWPLFDHLEKHYASILHFGTAFDDHRLLHDEYTAVDFENPNLRMKDMDPEQFAKMIPLWMPVKDKFVKFLMNPMKSLQLTHYEMTYLLAQILWTVQDVIGISENAQRVAEEVSEQIASELHNYYVYDMRLTNYAPRLVKLTKLIAAAKAVLNAKKDVFVIARVFDLFDCDVVGADLCDWKN